jgi:hypothetical protein
MLAEQEWTIIPMIINIPLGAFGGPLRNGDMIGVANVVEYLRKTEDTETKFYLTPESIHSAEYCQKFYKFLLENTDYFSATPGEKMLPWKNINLWDFRGIAGDVVKIKNTKLQEKKIVIFPLFNAPYNFYRNWPTKLFENIIHFYNQPEYKDYKKIICTEDNVSAEGWETSKDFMTNIEHIMTSEIFIGGDTGTSHFVGALEGGPNEIIYYYSGHGLLHTTPINALNGKGRIVMYWKDPENSQWR